MKLKLGTANEIFHCPKGQWSGECEAIDEPKHRINRPCGKQVRLRFRVTTEEGEKLVGKTFCADLVYGSELYNYLASWLDGDFEQVLDDLVEVDLDLLIGKKADLLINHTAKTDAHGYPFVNIAGIFPRGRLIEE